MIRLINITDFTLVLCLMVLISCSSNSEKSQSYKFADDIQESSANEVEDEELNVFSNNSDELLNQSNNVGSDKYDIPAYLRNKNK